MNRLNTFLSSVIAVFIVLILAASPALSQQTDIEESLYYRVTVPIANSETIRTIGDLGLPIDHVHYHERVMHAEFSGYDLNLLTEAGIDCQIYQADMASYYEQKLTSDELFHSRDLTGSGAPQNFKLGSMGGHLTLDEVIDEMDLMHELFPNLITEKFSIGQSYEGRDIWTVWMGTELDEEKPQAYYNSLIHAREPMSMMNLVYYMWWLLENYGEDEMATFLLDERHLAFTLVLNPDGYEFNRQNSPNGGGMHRKNMRPNGTTNPGVDLNRNFGPEIFWDHPNGGSSTSPSSDTYRGPAPFSEPETQALKAFVLENSFRTVFNYHNFSDLLIYPYGALQRQTADAHIFLPYAKQMTAFNNYLYGTDQETVNYSTRGGADDWFYGFEEGNDNRVNAISMTPEVGSVSDGTGGVWGAFWARADRIVRLSQDNIYPNQLLALFAGPALRQTELTSIGAFQPYQSLSPEISLNSAEAGGETFFNLFFDEVLYNAGRYGMEVNLTASTDAEFVAFMENTVSFTVDIDDSFAGSTPEFVMELDSEVPDDMEFVVTIDMDIPFTQDSFSWDFIFTTFGSPVSAEPGHELPRKVALKQNYPNPFNPDTSIQFMLPESAEVTLEVYDTMGRRVQTLVNGSMSAGEHRVNFDASSLSSGVYLYRLTTGSEAHVRKMTLLK
ncbi:MAG: T9SS type A sorting domain-containing protein [Balneolia bacterium]|nr:T9SS type A sorting domain-containing protein [Balneolia bacterium]